jgi:hypothetical protein
MNKCCCICQKNMNDEKKPWMILNHEYNHQTITYCCSYICSKRIEHVVGKYYSHKVINKEDFNMLFPILNDKKENNSFNTNMDYETIQDEIDEEERIFKMEEEFYDSCGGYSSEEFYE